MDPESIFSEVKKILKANTTIKSYVNEIDFLSGDRPSTSRLNFPNIILEIINNSLYKVEENNQQIKIFKMMIEGGILVQDFEKQIIGDTSSKGILDFEKDIYNALLAYYPDLNSNCLYFTLSTNAYTELASGNGRVVFIEADFYYRT